MSTIACKEKSYIAFCSLRNTTGSAIAEAKTLYSVCELGKGCGKDVDKIGKKAV